MSIKKLKNAFVTGGGNVGDTASSPLLYFNFPGWYSSFISIEAPRWWESGADLFIIGGGGVLQGSNTGHLRELVELRDTHDPNLETRPPKSVMWGGGTNCHGFKRVGYPTDVLNGFNLVGVRDWGTGYDWVPCASCMNEEFDSPGPVEHDVVIYDNHQCRVPVNEDFPRMDNKDVGLEGVIKFLSSGRLVLTSSYHGAYWAQLIGRPVVMYPWSSKFWYMKYRPPMILDPKRSWLSLKKKLRVVDGYLQECRFANTWFHERVLRLMERVK